MFPWSSRLYSIRKCRHLLRDRYRWYGKHASALDPTIRARYDTLFKELDSVSLAGDRTQSDRLARELEALPRPKTPRSVLWYALEFVVAVVVALVVATCVRQMWFEPYKIPTGSMRPTFSEQDHLIVSKTAFGLNTPLQTSHLLFDPHLVKRSDVVVWSGEGIDLPDTDTVYFWLFPGKKRYIKRLMGLPGDSLYFYGGRIYGVDAQGHDITDELMQPQMTKLEYVPFNTFEGRATLGRVSRVSPTLEVILKQLNEPVGRFNITANGASDGQVYNGHEWVKDNPQAARQPHSTIETYTDFLGMRNYAMARILTAEQLKSLSGLDPAKIGNASLYLELRHTPNLTHPKPRVMESGHGLIRFQLTPFVTAIPLDEALLKTLMAQMYTSRFVVSQGYITAWQSEGSPIHSGSPAVPQAIPDGTYEFYYGKAYSVNWGGVREELPANHPLYSLSSDNIQLLFNLGMDLNTAYSPYSPDQSAYPARYAYFRQGDFYVMGGPLLTADSPVLKAFVESEAKREAAATERKPYVAFRDHGPPLKDGVLDVAFVRAFGVTLPEGKYLVLGDNHARSADSRTFGFVPEENLQGSPVILAWPPGERWGPYSQPQHHAWLTAPALIVWGIVAFCLAVWYWRDRRLMTRPISQA